MDKQFTQSKLQSHPALKAQSEIFQLCKLVRPCYGPDVACIPECTCVYTHVLLDFSLHGTV